MRAVQRVALSCKGSCNERAPGAIYTWDTLAKHDPVPVSTKVGPQPGGHQRSPLDAPPKHSAHHDIGVSGRPSRWTGTNATPRISDRTRRPRTARPAIRAHIGPRTPSTAIPHDSRHDSAFGCAGRGYGEVVSRLDVRAAARRLCGPSRSRGRIVSRVGMIVDPANRFQVRGICPGPPWGRLCMGRITRCLDAWKRS